MPRLATLISALLLALPATAFAQGAGDDQYQDPFGDQAAQQQGGSGSSGGGGQAQSAQDGGLSDEPPSTGGGSGSSGSGAGAAGQTGTTTTPQTPAPATTESAQAAGQLPNTGSDPRALLLCGLAFVLIGVGLRLRTIDPDAY